MLRLDLIKSDPVYDIRLHFFAIRRRSCTCRRFGNTGFCGLRTHKCRTYVLWYLRLEVADWTYENCLSGKAVAGRYQTPLALKKSLMDDAGMIVVYE